MYFLSVIDLFLHVIVLIFHSLDISSCCLSFFVQLVKATKLLKEACLITSTAHKCPCILFVRCEHSVTTASAACKGSASDGHGVELSKVAPQLVWHKPEDTAQGMQIRQHTILERGWCRGIDSAREVRRRKGTSRGKRWRTRQGAAAMQQRAQQQRMMTARPGQGG